MAGKTKYIMAAEALKEHDGREMSLSELRLIIMKKLSVTQIDSYIQLLAATGITKEVRTPLEGQEWRFKIQLPSNDKQDTAPSASQGHTATQTG